MTAHPAPRPAPGTASWSPPPSRCATTCSVDYDAYAEHVAWLIAERLRRRRPQRLPRRVPDPHRRGAGPRRRTAVEAAGDGARVMPGVAAYGSAEARRWAEQAAEAGAGSVLLLPPNAYRADERAVRRPLRRGRPGRAARRRVQQPASTPRSTSPPPCSPGCTPRAASSPSRSSAATSAGPTRSPNSPPDLDLLIGADDVLLELALAGAVGWIAGYPNALPAACAELYRAAVAGDLDTALPLYQSPAPAAALGLQDRVRPGHQAVHGPRRPPRRPRAARRASRSPREQRGRRPRRHREGRSPTGHRS